MALRPVWKGSIIFGMVIIPCRLYKATSLKKISFHRIHEECGGRIQKPMWCPLCERKVGKEETKRTFEYAKDQEMILEESDFEKLPLKTLHTIEITEFCQPEQIDPRSPFNSYFAAPQEVGMKSFILLRKAMEATGLGAISKLTFQEREHLAFLRPFNEVLLLQTLHYPDELRDSGGLKPMGKRVSKKELSLAIELVNSLKTEKLSLRKYHNEYKEALTKIIEAKLTGREISVPKIKVPEYEDLSEALTASIKSLHLKNQDSIRR